MSKTVFDKSKVVVIVGQTATGKSALAVLLAKEFNGEIISADSRQVYTGLDIGSGKITKKEMKGIPHHLLDVINPKKKFTVVDFKNLAEKKIEEILKSGKVPIIAGGTGFYIDTVVKGEIYPEVKPNLKLRKELSTKTTEVLFKMLQKIDKNRAKTIDSKNPVRLIRAIEIAKTLGHVPKKSEVKPRYEFIKIGLELSQQDLKRNIEKRVKKMFRAGLLKEIENLKKKGISKKRLAEFGFEYNDPTLEKVILGTLQYAKRQATWFKRDQEIKWFTPSEVEGFKQGEFEKIKRYIKKSL